jgi:hypothetical protein
LFIPETAGTPHAARFLFAALGMQAIGYSPFGLDYTRTNHPERMVPNEPNAFLDPTAQNYKLLSPMMRDVARLNFEGKLQAVAEVEGPAQADASLRKLGRSGLIRRWPGRRCQRECRADRARTCGSTERQSVSCHWTPLPRRLPSCRHRSSNRKRRRSLPGPVRRPRPLSMGIGSTVSFCV